MEDLKVVVGLRGAENLFCGGFKYSKRRSNGQSVTWRCSHNKKLTCSGSLKTTILPYSNPVLVTEHSHSPDPNEVEVEKMRLGIREEAINSRANPAGIVSKALHNSSDETKKSIGPMSTIKRDVRSARKKKFPPIPKNVKEWDLPEEWKMTGGASSKPFLIHDSGTGSPFRLVVFATIFQLQFLSQSKTWFMDGTFKMSTNLFRQIYVVRAEKNNATRTCVYAFMSEKTTIMYKELLQVILRKILDLVGQLPRPKTVMIDFEAAAISAIQTTFGQDVEIKCCFFHLCQSTWRHIQHYGLVTAYKKNALIKTFCGMIDALAFLPLAKVKEGMQVLWESSPFELSELLYYFDSTYVSGILGSTPKPPTFPPELWNVHEATIGGSHRTNNMCEAWNNKFNSLVGQQNPSIWTILEAIRKDEAVERVYHLGDRKNEDRKKNKYVMFQQKLKVLCEEYVSGCRNIESFLKAVGSAIRMK